MQKLGPSDAPFETSNAALAFSLHKAGVPFADARQPCRNLYTPEIVFTAGGGKKDGAGNLTRASRYAGLDFGIDLVKEVFNEGRGPKGLVLYGFKRVASLSRLLRAYSAQEKECETTDFIGRDFELKTMQEIASEQIDAAEGLLRIACVDQQLRKNFMGMWRKMVPQLQVENRGQIKTHDTPQGKVSVHPGFRAASVNLSPANRKKMKL